ncbi:MAG: MutS-related protein [Steroidobacteraceae bacterium]
MMFPDFRAIARLVSPTARRREKFRKSWGCVGDADGWLATTLFDLRRTGNPSALDDKTWRDLELAAFFHQLDTTVTKPGSQYLYNQLRTFEFDSNVSAERYATYRLLARDERLREALQLALSRLDFDSAAYIVEVLFGPPPSNLRYPRLLYTWALCCLGALALVAPLGLWWIVPVILCANGVVQYTTPAKLRRYTEALIQGPRLLAVADRLASIEPHGGSIPQLASLQAERRKRARLRKELRWLTVLSDSSAIWAGFSQAANWLFLAQLVAYSRTVRRFMDSRHGWASTFELVASVDAAIAVASFLHRTPVHCPVTVTTDPTIAISEGYHPLIAHSVPNSIALTRRSALITGSNMTGKTTYMKMAGVNIVLGHTLGFCLARSATLPRSPVMASVRSDQSVESGKSGYSAEVEAIGEFVDRAAAGECRIFILDEPFRGTNTLERIAVAKAVLDALSADAQVLATTHDVELQQLLTDRFDFFYFREDPDVKGFFDFEVRRGTSRERNAIRVLERMGFPAKIVSAALSQLEKLPKP